MIFDRRLETTNNGTAFLRRQDPLPIQSTGFWVASDDVRKSQFDEYGVKYWLPEGRVIRKVTCKGMDDPVDVIPAGALIRFRLLAGLSSRPAWGSSAATFSFSRWYG